MIKLVAPIAGWFAVLSVSANADQVANTCHVFDDAGTRLACYDSQTSYEPKETQEAAATTPAKSPGSQWREAAETSALDGRKDVWLSVDSKNTQPNQIGSPEHARIWVRCMQNSTNFFVTFNDFTSDNQNVRFKIDEGSVQRIWMVHMRGGDGIGIWSGGKAIPFVKNLFDASDLTIAYKSFSNNNLEFDFDISGLRERIDPLANSCEWKP